MTDLHAVTDEEAADLARQLSRLNVTTKLSPSQRLALAWLARNHDLTQPVSLFTFRALQERGLAEADNGWRLTNLGRAAVDAGWAR